MANYSRHKLRELALQTLYQLDINQESLEKNLGMLSERLDKDFQLAGSFLEKIIRGTYEYQLELDTKLNRYAQGWHVERMGKIDRNILRLALYEILYCDDIPIEVSIDEAVELAKSFAAEEAPSFINGVLGKIVEKLEE